MSKRKQKPILSDKIAELIAPRRLLDPEIDSEDETTARVIDYDINEDLDDTQPASKLSDIRKKNVKLLQDVDVKYRGKVSSRKEMDMDSNESDENIDDDSEDDEEIKSTEKSIGEFSMMLTPRQRIKMAKEDDENDEDDDMENDVSDSDDEENLKAFTMKLNKSNAKSDDDEEQSDSDEDLIANDEIEKWDDDYEGEEVEEEEESEQEGDGGLDEESGEQEQDDFGSDDDEDESDFDGGDIIPQASEEPSEKPDLSRILPKQQKHDHLSKGVCVQNQLQIWEKLLEVRIHSQKTLIKANSLPQPEKFGKLSENTEFAELANDTVHKVSRLVSQMRDLQSLLLNQYTETKQIAAKRKPIKLDDFNESEAKRTRLANELDKDYSNFKEYQYSVISKWHDRTKVLTPGSIKTQRQQGNIDVIRKIEGVLANRGDLIKKSQQLKGSFELFDKSTGIVESKKITDPENDENNEENENGDANESTYSSEVYDDTDFYHTQLRELIEYKTASSSNASEMAKQFTELQKLRKKMKKTVDTRASKGRKIRFVVHNKLVSFMAPNEPGRWTVEQKDELFKSLFGAQS